MEGGCNQILIKDGLIVNYDGKLQADILIEGEKIKQIATNIQPGKNVEVIEASGFYVFPGGVDSDCRLLNLPTGHPRADDCKMGSIASLIGGTTTIINRIATCSDGSVADAYSDQYSILEAECYCDFALTLSVPSFSAKIANEMKALADDKKVASFSFRLRSGAPSNDPFASNLDEEGLMNAMHLCASMGIPASIPACGNSAVLDKIADTVFSEGITGPEGSLLASPEQFEADTIYRVGVLAGVTYCPTIFTCIHSNAALEALVKQRSLDNVIFGTTNIAAIGCAYAGSTITHSNWPKAAACVSDPPIRAEKSVARNLLTQVATSEIMAVSSAHRAVATSIQAGLGLNDFRRIPSGQATAGGRLGALWKIGVEKEALLSPCAFVGATSTNAARLYNLYPRKGCIAEGSDADIVIWNPDSKANPVKLVPEGVEDLLEGLNYSTCRPQIVILRGKVVVKHGNLVETSKPSGRFIRCEGFNDLVFGRTAALKAVGEAKMVSITREPYCGPVVNKDSECDQILPPQESHFYRKSDYDNALKEAFPPGQRVIRTSVKTAQPPGGASTSFWKS